MFDNWLVGLALVVLVMNWPVGVLFISLIIIWVLRRTRAIFLRKKWLSVKATIAGKDIHGSGEETVLHVTAFFTLDGKTYCVTINANPSEQVNYPFGSHISLLVNPRKPERYIIDRTYSGNFEWLAYWLADRLLQLQQRRLS